MMRMIVLPIAAKMIYVLEGVLADLDRHLASRLHDELRKSRPRNISTSRSRRGPS
jgi:hypothetical protein